jgi:hypothetical protein
VLVFADVDHMAWPASRRDIVQQLCHDTRQLVGSTLRRPGFPESTLLVLWTHRGAGRIRALLHRPFSNSSFCVWFFFGPREFN